MAGFAEYGQYDALGLADLVRRGDVGAREVTEAAIERIEARDPAVNAVVRRYFEAALDEADAANPAAPLAGVPYLVKDLGVMMTGRITSGGSKLFADVQQAYDSTIAERMRAAGLIVLGQTNTPEFGLSVSTEPALLGICRNPWNLEHSAGGSSGGAAAAVAARMVPAAHATDGGGSIRVPAACCGLFGLKPTRGRNPAGPIVGEGWGGLSCGHAVSRTVRDSAALLDATHGPAAGDPYAAPPPPRPFLQEVGAATGALRIALMTTPLDGAAIDPECRAAVEAAAKLCESLGHTVEEARPEVDLERMREATGKVIGANVAHTLNQAARTLGRDVDADDVELHTWEFAQYGRQVDGPSYVENVNMLHAVGRRMGEYFAQYDVLLSPTLAQPPVKIGHLDTMTLDMQAWSERFRAYCPFTALFNVSGGPAASLPLHWSADGLPIGVMIGADFGNEAVLFRLAAQLEQAQPWIGRTPPNPA